MRRGWLIVAALLLLYGVAGTFDRQDAAVDLTAGVDRAAVMAWATGRR